MNNQIKIASLKEVLDNIDYIKRNNVNLISIRDNSPEQSEEQGYEMIDNMNLPNLLVVSFDDLVDPLDYKLQRRERPPSEYDISTILEWAKQKIKENNNPFIVHCTAGVSRSSAVAILVSYLQNPETALKIINPIIHSPNEKVLEIGEKLLNTQDIKEPTKKLIKQYDEQFIEQLGKGKTSLF
jgi:predicted protein tyrosine phosphatase